VEHIIPFAFITAAIAQVLGTIVYLVNAGRLLRRLETQHGAVHESVGSPSLLLSNTPRNNVLFLRWIWNRDFNTLDDPKTIALSLLVRSLLVSLVVGFLVTIALFLVMSTQF
jgi:hypothetical protein